MGVVVVLISSIVFIFVVFLFLWAYYRTGSNGGCSFGGITPILSKVSANSSIVVANPDALGIQCGDRIVFISTDGSLHCCCFFNLWFVFIFVSFFILFIANPL